MDAVIIATPHFQHTTLGIAALKAGVHAMVEKPISSHKADAERLIAAHKQFPKIIFAGMFQLRTEPRYLKIQKLIREDLGRLVRVNWINTDWYRTEAYYASGGWRATWPGGKNPFAPFSGNGVQYTDDVSSWATVESADDYTIPTILIFARRAGP